MIKHRYAWLALVLALLAAFAVAPFSGVAAATKDKNVLKNVPVSGTLEDGGRFKGRVSITQFGYSETGGLWVSGRVIGTATTAAGTRYQDITQSFSQVHATLNEPSGATGLGVAATCQILDLDIGAIHLDLLGLVVDLAPIHLDITAVSGPGNLLGNLLCALVGLLDPNGFLTDLIGGLTQLLDLLNQINQVL